jgi:hypothetical protein
MEQFLAAQTQLLTNMANTIANMQAQMNQAPPPPPPPTRDRHKEFMSHKPPTFSHSPDPLQADDWIKSVEKMLNLAQCTDREKVLYASGRLEGTAADWWDAYTAAHDNPDTINWQEFRSRFREQHIPKGLMKLKKQEFLALRQGTMSVSEYRDKFIQLSRYAPADVADDEEKQDHFREGLIGPIKYQLMVHTFDSFQKMVDKAIMVEHARKKMGEQKKKIRVINAVQQQCTSSPQRSAGNTLPPRRTKCQFWAKSVLALQPTGPTATARSVRRSVSAALQLSAESPGHSHGHTDEKQCHCSRQW